MKKIVFLSIVFSYGLTLHAQDWKADIEQAYAIFSEPNLEVEVEQLLYPSAAATVPVERETIYFARQGDKYRIRQYGTEFVSDGSYVVFVNTSAGIVAVKQKETQQADTKPSEGMEILQQSIANLAKAYGLDTLQQQEQYTCSYLGEHNGTKSYRFDYAYGEYTQTTVYLSVKTGLLEQISGVFRQAVEIEEGTKSQPRIDFVYKRQSTGKDFDGSLFSISGIIAFDAQGAVTLKEKYSNYRLLNNIRK
ncbi:MAG: hypothetical protein LBR81_09845 [Prevotellaceae bacterium]|jgi:hypothetical protein|nr:hypothetical protein [Prevotellaceae bacterium]